MTAGKLKVDCIESERKNMRQSGFFKNQIRMTGTIVLITAMVSLTGCQGGPLSIVPGTGQATTAGSQPSNASQAGPSNTSQGSSQSSNTSVPAPPSHAAQALSKYQAARQGLRSERITQLWSVESNYPMKTGKITFAANYDLNGKVQTAMGSREESEGVDTSITTWYRTESEYTVDQKGTVTTYSLAQVKEAPIFDLDALLTRLLETYSASLEDGTYYVKLATQDSGLIRNIMEDLGYRKTEEDAYEGNLYLEAMINERTGYLDTLNYTFKHRIAGYTDNGSISTSDQNLPVDVSVPKTPGQTKPGGGTSQP